MLYNISLHTKLQRYVPKAARMAQSARPQAVAKGADEYEDNDELIAGEREHKDHH